MVWYWSGGGRAAALISEAYRSGAITWQHGGALLPAASRRIRRAAQASRRRRRAGLVAIENLLIRRLTMNDSRSRCNSNTPWISVKRSDPPTQPSHHPPSVHLPPSTTSKEQLERLLGTSTHNIFERRLIPHTRDITTYFNFETVFVLKAYDRDSF